MKIVSAIINPLKLDAVRNALAEIGAKGVTVTEVKGYGHQRGHTEMYRGAVVDVKFNPKVKLEVAIEDALVDPVIEAISKVAKTGHIGAGKIFVTPLERVVRIRTDETGETAL